MFDHFRTPPFRLLGYGFAIGEAMRYVFSAKAVNLAYDIGTGFVLVHVIHHTFLAVERGAVSSFYAFAETMCWEGLASVMLPTLFNYYICRFAADSLYECEGIPGVAKRWGPFVVGICMIPLYMRHVDPFVMQILKPIFYPHVAYYVVD